MRQAGIPGEGLSEGLPARHLPKGGGDHRSPVLLLPEQGGCLLAAVAGETLRGLNQIIRAHFSREIDTDARTALAGDASEDIQSAKEILHYLYRHYDMVLFLLTKSQGSSYETIADRFADVLEQHYDRLTEQLSARLGIPKPDRYILHWASHMQIDAFVHLLTHVEEEEKALEHIEQIVSYLVAGWAGAFGAGKRTLQLNSPAGKLINGYMAEKPYSLSLAMEHNSVMQYPPL